MGQGFYFSKPVPAEEIPVVVGRPLFLPRDAGVAGGPGYPERMPPSTATSSGTK
jgi:hypothetical protein